MNIRRIHTLYDPGTTKVPEDVSIVRPPFFGVGDGTSGVSEDPERPMLFTLLSQGKDRPPQQTTGGRVAALMLDQAFTDATPETDLGDALRTANDTLRATVKVNFAGKGPVAAEGYDENTDIIPGTGFACAKISPEDDVRIVQSGDCLVFWLFRNGKSSISTNQIFGCDLRLRQVMTDLLGMHAKKWVQARREWLPELRRVRRAHINRRGGECGGYCLLNGQPCFENFWQKITLQRDELSVIIFLTDGFVPFELTDPKKKQDLCAVLYRKWSDGGLDAILRLAREASARDPLSSAGFLPEATAVAIEF